MRIRPLILALVAAPLLTAPGVDAAESAPTPPKPPAKPLTGAHWDSEARAQAKKEALSAESAAAIERTRNSDPDAAPSDSIEVFGVDDGKPKRGDSQRSDGGAITWIDGNCFYAAPPSQFEPGATTRLWMPTCKPGSTRVLSLGRKPKPPGPVADSDVDADAKPLTLPVSERHSVPAGAEVSRASTEDPR